MTKIFTSETARTLASIAGALVLSTTFVAAAVGPAKAAAPASGRIVSGPAAF